MSTQILLLDLSGLCHQLWHVSGTDPDPDATSRKVVERVRAIASGQPHVAICLDTGRSFRRELDATYKANRPTADAALQHQIATAVETLKGDGFPCWGAAGFEADDVIASATTMFNGAEMPNTFVIISNDKDLRALVSDRVTVKTFTDGTVYDIAKVQEKHGVRPEQMVDYLALVGDASDNIKGCTNVGEKKAAALLQKFGTLEDLFVALTEHGTLFTPGLATHLREFEPRMAAVRALITLRTDVPVPFDEVFKERVPSDTAVFAGGEMDDIDATMQPLTEEKRPEPPVDINKARAESAERVEARLTESNAQHRAEASREATGLGPAPAPAQQTNGAQSAPFPAREGEVLPAPSNVFEMQLEPRSLREAALLSQEMFKSRLFSAYGSYQGVLSTVLAGRELGLQAMASLRAFHIIDGKPCLSADLIRALVLKSGHAEYFRCTERTPEKATFLTKRKGDPEISLTFTVAEGRAAFVGDDKAWSKSGWGRNPADMCVARASAKLARLVYADIVFNLYDPTEVSE